MHGYVAKVGEEQLNTQFSLYNHKQIYYMGDLDVDERIILKLISQKWLQVCKLN